MIILTDCMGAVVDEGGMKVANSLAKRIKAADPSVTIVSYGSEAMDSDVHCPANKLLLSWPLIRLLLKRREPVLYLPSYARTLPTAVRVFILSLFARWGLRVVIVMRAPIKKLSSLLLRLSGVEVLCLSEESCEAFRAVIRGKAGQLKTGVDTQRFVPVSQERKLELRRKYSLPADKPLVLHVGHMKEGRNVGELLKVDDRFHVLLVVSTLTAAFEDHALRERLQAKNNLTIIDSYVPHIEEIYQLADVYFFPVVAQRNCIDVPLSALEAAACGVPVVATPYGELKQLLHNEGFYRIDSFDAGSINMLLETSIQNGVNPREHVLPYDWANAVKTLLQ